MRLSTKKMLLSWREGERDALVAKYRFRPFPSIFFSSNENIMMVCGALCTK